MDVDLYSRSINKGFKFSRVPKLLGKFRVHDLSKTQNRENEKKVYQEYKNVLANNFNFNTFDHLIFAFFQLRAKATKVIKQKLLKK